MASIRVASRVAERLKTCDLRELGNFKEIPKTLEETCFHLQLSGMELTDPHGIYIFDIFWCFKRPIHPSIPYLGRVSCYKDLNF